jgi:hypothetical protein
VWTVNGKGKIEERANMWENRLRMRLEMSMANPRMLLGNRDRFLRLTQMLHSMSALRMSFLAVSLLLVR